MEDITVYQLLQPEVPNRFCQPFPDVFFWLSKIFAAKCNFTGGIHIEKLGPGVLKHAAHNCSCIVKRLFGNLGSIYPYFSRHLSLIIMWDQSINQAGDRSFSTPTFTAKDNKLTILYI